MFYNIDLRLTEIYFNVSKTVVQQQQQQQNIHFCLIVKLIE